MTQNNIVVFNLVLTILFVVGVKCHALEHHHVTALDDAITLSPYIEYLEDPQRDISYTDVSSNKYDHLWKRNTDEVFVGRNVQSRYWFRLNLEIDPLVAAKSPILYFPIHPFILYKLNLWIPNDALNFTAFETGALRAQGMRDIQHPLYAFELPISHYRYSIIGWADNELTAQSFLLPIKLVKNEQWQFIKERHLGILFGFYAILFMFIITSSCIFLTWRNRMHAYLVFLVVASMLFTTTIDSAFAYWIPPDVTLFSLARLLHVFVLLTSFAYLLLAWELLDGLIFSRTLQKAFIIMFYLAGASILIGVTIESLSIRNSVSHIYAVTAVTLGLASTIKQVANKTVSPLYLLLASLFAMMTYVGFLLVTTNKIPLNDYSMWVVHIGLLGQIILFQLAIDQKHRVLALQQNKKLIEYQQIYENSLEGRFQFNLTNYNLTCNQAFLDVLGYASKDTLLKANLAGSIDQVVIDDVKSIIMRKGFLSGYEIKIAASSKDETKWLMVNACLHSDVISKQQFVEGSVVDATERKRKDLEEHAILTDLLAYSTCQLAKITSVLFISANSTLMDTVAVLLRRIDVAVECALSPETAMESTKHTHFDVIILDGVAADGCSEAVSEIRQQNKSIDTLWLTINSAIIDKTTDNELLGTGIRMQPASPSMIIKRIIELRIKPKIAQDPVEGNTPIQSTVDQHEDIDMKYMLTRLEYDDLVKEELLLFAECYQVNLFEQLLQGIAASDDTISMTCQFHTLKSRLSGMGLEALSEKAKALEFFSKLNCCSETFEFYLQCNIAEDLAWYTNKIGNMYPSEAGLTSHS